MSTPRCKAISRAAEQSRRNREAARDDIHFVPGRFVVDTGAMADAILDSFSGFPASALTFYEGLEADNSRDYWHSHKEQYLRDVKRPMEALLEELVDEFGSGKIFRPNRDVRFSADKSPYKDHCGAIVGPSNALGYYVQISADGLAAGGGFHTDGAASTAAIRAAIDAPASGIALRDRVAECVADGFEILGAAVKTTPRGYPADHERIELLRRKELMLIKSFGDPAWLTTSETADQVRDAWSAVRPVVEWFKQHVPAS